MKQLSIGYSTCPNDTYIFDALVHNKIDHDYRFNVFLEDVESLNQTALKNALDISKISIHAWFHLTSNYELLSSGAALGRGCGPLLIGKSTEIPKTGKIALPGDLTTATLLFKIALPGDFEFVQMTFDEIIPAILKNEVDGGVIIHESRFTYQNYGLFKKLDLGQWWEDETGCMIPLGGIMIKRQISEDIKKRICRLIKQSILFANQYPKESINYVKSHAKEIEDKVIKSHIKLYVNDHSIALQNSGIEAIQELFSRAVKNNIVPNINNGIISNLIIQ